MTSRSTPDSGKQSTHRRLTSKGLVAVSTLSVALAFGCGNNGSTGTAGANGNGNGNENGDATGAAGGNGGTERPLFAVAQSLFDPVTFAPTGFFQVVSELEGRFTLDQAIEVPGGIGLFGGPPTGQIWVGNGESPTIRRYAVAEDGAIREDAPALSLASFGITETSQSTDRVPFISATKAYFIERTGAVIVVWNPDTMEIEGSIDITLPRRDGFRTNLEAWPTVVENRLYIAFGWWDFTNARVDPGAGVAVIDTENDSVVSVTQDPRCAGIFHSGVADDGYIYYSCGVYPAAAHRIFGDSNAPESCLLRIRAGESEFDPDFYVPIETLTDGRPGGELVGSGEDLFVRAFYEDESGLSIGDESTTFDITSAEAWRWWRLGAGASSAEELTSLPFSGAGSAPYLLDDGRVFTSQPNLDFSESTLVELNAEDGPEVRATAVGDLNGLIRVL